MSVEAITYVWSTSKQKRTSLLLMLALADYANHEGQCWPGIKALAQKTRMTERNTQLLLQKMADAKEITIDANSGKQTDTGKTNRYTINGFTDWLKAVHEISPLKSKGVKNRATRGEKSGSQGVKEISPDPSLESVNDPSIKIQLSNTANAGSTQVPSPVAIVDAVIDQGHDDLDTMVSKVTAALESPSIKEGLESGQTPPPTPSPSPTTVPLSPAQKRERKPQPSDPLFDAVAKHFFAGVNGKRVGWIIWGNKQQGCSGLTAFECAYQGKGKAALDYNVLAGLVAKFAADYRKDDPRRELKDCNKFMERWEGWRKHGELLGNSKNGRYQPTDYISDPYFKSEEFLNGD